jgi:hypothetical protein
MKVFGMLELICPEKEFPLFFQVQPVVIFQIPGNDGVIKGLPGYKFPELMPGIQALKNYSDRAVQKKYSQDQ